MLLNALRKIVILNFGTGYSGKLLEFQWFRILHHFLLIYLFLHIYKMRLLRQLKKSDRRSARIFAYVFRFVDDLTVINDASKSERSCKTICPPEFQLKKENIDCSEGSFFDLIVKIVLKKKSINFHDKRDDFLYSTSASTSATTYQ